MAKKVTDDEIEMEPLVRFQLGYYHFLLPISKATEFLMLTTHMRTVERNYLGTGKPGADSDGYASSNIKRVEATLTLVDMGEICKILAIQRMEEADKDKAV